MMHYLTALSALITMFIAMISPRNGLAASPKAAAKAPASIAFAYQPMASPGGTVIAVVKRDRILRKALARSGTTLQFILAAKGMDTIRHLKESQAVFATVGDMPLIEASEVDSLKIFAQLKNNYSMVVGERGTVPKDLRGKRIGNAYATTGHFALLKVLASAKLTEKDVTLVPLEVNEMPEALRSGKIDAFAAWEPIASSTIAKNPARYSAIGRQSSTAFIVAAQPFAEQNPAVVMHVAAAVTRAMRWLQHDVKNIERAAEWNRSDMIALTGKEPTMSAQAIARYNRDDLTALNYSPKISRRIATASSILAEELTFLKRLGKVSPTVQWVDISKNLDFTVLDHILSKPAKSDLDHFDYEE